MIDKYKINQLGLVISLFFVSLYVIFAYYWSINIEIVSDTQEYFYFFQNIQNEIYPIDGEYFTFLFMWIINILGFDFREYIFFNSCLWIPFVFFMFYKGSNLEASKVNLIFFLIGLTFLLPHFFINLSYLIRQMNGFLFFLYFVVFGRGVFLRLLFFSLSITSHMSSMLYFIVFNKFSTIFIIKFKYYFFILVLLLKLTNFIDYFADYLFRLTLNDALDRKLAILDSVGFNFNLTFVIINFIIVFLIFFINFDNLKTIQYKKIVCFVYVNSLVYILFSDNPILANRMAFSSFFFILPSLLIVVKGFIDARFHK